MMRQQAFFSKKTLAAACSTLKAARFKANPAPIAAPENPEHRSPSG
jgi:hypothetical protein